MRISIDGVFAKCYECGCEDFERKVEAEEEQSALLHCARCRHGIAYEELIHQIGAQAVLRPTAEAR